MRAGTTRPRPFWRSLTPIVAALSLAACDDDPGTGPEPGPCDHPDACVVAGPDLVVRTPVVLWPDAVAVDSETGLSVIDPATPINVEFTVLNRGDVATDTTTLTVGIPAGNSVGIAAAIPSLGPGERYTDTVSVTTPDDIGFRMDTVRIAASLDPFSIADDPLYGNDHNRSDAFHVALPVLVAALDLPTTELRAGDTYEFGISIENRSRHASAAAARVAFCWYAFDHGCGVSGVGAPFGLLDMPALGPGETWSLTQDVTIGVDAGFPWDPWSFSMYVCVGPVDAELDDFGAGDETFSTHCIPDAVEINSFPNIPAMCDVAVVAADTLLTDAVVADCLAHDEFDARDVFAVDAVAGEEYEITGSAFSGAVDDHGRELEMNFVGTTEDDRAVYRLVMEHTERIYLLAFTRNDDYSIELRRVP